MKEEAPRDNPLGKAPVTGLIVQFAGPTIISMMVAAIYNITDQIFIGHLVGMLGNAATNVVFPTVTLVTAFAQMIGVGTAANFNINMGAKKENAAKDFVLTGLTMIFAAGILLGIAIAALKKPILLLCGATDAVYPYAFSYLTIAAIGIPFQLISTSGSFLIRADGSPLHAMICTGSGAVLNVFLDALFMLRFHWGIQGAAAATVIGQMVSAALCIRYFRRFRSFPLPFHALGLKKACVIQIASLGLSNFINQIIMVIVNITLNHMLVKYGALSIYGSDIPLAVSGVAAKLNSILSAFAVGLAMGCQPIWSFNLGAKKYSRVKETYIKALMMALAVGIIIFIAFQFFPRDVIRIFGGGDQLYYQFAEKYLRIYMMMVCIYSIQPMTVDYFTGTGGIKQGIVLSLSRQGFFLLPLMFVLPFYFGLDGVLFSAPIADVLASILAIFMIVRNFKCIQTQKHEQ